MRNRYPGEDIKAIGEQSMPNVFSNREKRKGLSQATN